MPHGNLKRPSDDTAPLLAEEIARDDSMQDQDISNWPAETRQQWMEYRQAWTEQHDPPERFNRMAFVVRVFDPADGRGLGADQLGQLLLADRTG